MGLLVLAITETFEQERVDRVQHGAERQHIPAHTVTHELSVDRSPVLSCNFDRHHRRHERPTGHLLDQFDQGLLNLLGLDLIGEQPITEVRIGDHVE